MIEKNGLIQSSKKKHGLNEVFVKVCGEKLHIDGVVGGT
jgi:hypothetical protein